VILGEKFGEVQESKPFVLDIVIYIWMQVCIMMDLSPTPLHAHKRKKRE